MRIFKNANYNFIKWRWHALIGSLVIIWAGVATIFLRGGLPMGIEFRGGAAVLVQFDHHVSDDQVRHAIDPVSHDAQVQEWKGDSPESGDDSHSDGRGRGRGQDARHRRPRSRGRAEGREPRHVHGRATDRHRPGRRQRPAQQGHLGDGGRPGRHPRLRRLPLPDRVRRRRRRRRIPRHPDRARVPGVVQVRHDAQHHRRVADHHGLLGERHDRRLRPRAREPEAHAARAAGQDRQHERQPDAGPDDHHVERDAARGARALRPRRRGPARASRSR